MNQSGDKNDDTIGTQVHSVGAPLVHARWSLLIAVIGVVISASIVPLMNITGQTLVFAGVTLGFLLAVAVLTCREIRAYARVQRVLWDALPDSTLATLRQEFVAGGRHRDSLVDLLDGMAGRIRKCGPAARPLADQATDVQAVVRVSGDEPQELADAIRRNPTGAGISPWLRALDVAFVNTLLFIGIIGTFYGLILFLGNERFIQLIQSLGTGATLDKNDIPQILNGFKVAFGSSLVAYVAYLFGRFLVDLADDAFDETVKSLSLHINRRLPSALSIGATAGTVDIAPSVKRLLEKQTTELKQLAGGIGSLINRTEGIAGALLAAAAELSASVKASDDLTQGLQKAFSALKTDWDQTTARWRETTEIFSANAHQAATSISSSATQMVTLQETLAKTGTEMVGQLRELSEQTTTLLAQQEESLRHSFTAAAETFAGTLTTATDKLYTGLVGYGDAVTTLATGLQQTRDVQSALAQTMTSFEQTVRQGQVENQDTARQLAFHFGNRNADLAGALDRIHQTLSILSQSLRALDTALYGSEDAASLTTVLQELNSQIAAGMSPATPPLSKAN